MEQSDLSLLQAVPPYHLQAIVKARHTSQGFVGKDFAEGAELDLEEIADSLFEPRTCREIVQTLSEAEASILRELVASGGRGNSRDLALYLGSPGSPLASLQNPLVEKSASMSGQVVPALLPPARTSLSSTLYPTPHPHGVFEQALHHLLLLGLLFWGKQTNFVGRDYANGVYDGVLIVPQAVGEIVLDEWHMKEPFVPAPALPGETPGEGMYAFQRALYLYWSLVANARDGLPLVNSRLLSRLALRQVVEHFSPQSKFLQGLSPEQFRTEIDVPYLLFLRQMLLRLGLLVERQGALHALSARDFFTLPLGERVWRCFNLWLETPFWNELAFLPDVNVQPGPAPLDPAHEEVVHARQQVVQYIFGVAPETWHMVPTFIARMKLYMPYLLFPRQYGPRAERYSVGSNPYGWNFRLRRGWLTHREGWHLVEGGFIRTILSGPLAWLGIVDVNEEEHPNAFLLAQGAGLAAHATLSEAIDPTWGRLVVQPNFDLVALAPVPERLLVDLDRFAERVRLEHIAQYRLSKSSVTRAVQLGLSAEAIYQIIEEAAGGTIPQNVHYSLQEWERQARRVELWRAATLLEVDDPALLDELFAAPETSGLLLHRLAPTLAEVATGHLAHLQELLWQRDYLPAQTSAAQYQDLLNGAPLPASAAQWLLSPGGQFQPCYALNNLYLATELERITELDETTGWRKLTSASLQDALAQGLRLPHIIHFLQTYCVDGVPGSFLVRLKLWGEGYTEQSALHVESAPMLSLSNQILQDILVDEEIGPLLSEPVPIEKRLVRIPEQHLQRVVQLLRERGFEVS